MVKRKVVDAQLDFLGEGDGDNPKWGRRGAVSGGGKPEREQGGG